MFNTNLIESERAKWREIIREEKMLDELEQLMKSMSHTF
jgi:hypothetical protein